MKKFNRRQFFKFLRDGAAAAGLAAVVPVQKPAQGGLVPPRFPPDLHPLNIWGKNFVDGIVSGIDIDKLAQMEAKREAFPIRKLGKNFISPINIQTSVDGPLSSEELAEIVRKAIRSHTHGSIVIPSRYAPEVTFESLDDGETWHSYVNKMTLDGKQI